MANLFIDFETRSTVELKRTGVYPYASHRDTYIWCMAWAFDDEPVALWREGEPLPSRIAQHVEHSGALWAHNAQFERVMWRDCARRRYGFPTVSDAQWWCTAAEAAASGLPRKLETVCAVLGLPVQKDAAGYRVMLQLCRPRAMDDDGEPVWWDAPEKLDALYAYCRRDVDAERAVWRRLRRLTESERRVYLLDQAVNDRGVRLDRDLAVAVRDAAREEVARQNAAIAGATKGAVTKITQVARLRGWLAEQGVHADSLDKASTTALLADAGLPSDALVALAARAEGARSSVAKVDAMLDCVGFGDRMRGLLRYYGAHTGRWAGQLVQPQNFPRALEFEDAQVYIPPVLAGEKPEYRSSMAVYSALLRPMLTAAPGRKLLSGDFSAIEARALAWLSGCALMLEQFSQGRKIYHEMAARIFACSPEEIDKGSERYIVGKGVVLGCGFGMGAPKFASQVKAQTGLVIDSGLALAAVQQYRETYMEVPRYWDRVNAAALDAVRYPNEVFTAGTGKSTARFTARNGFLFVVLPSGRPMAYYRPRVVQRAVPWDRTDLRPAVEYEGFSSYTHQWEHLALYGGLITENIVQAVARDVLVDAVARVEGAGYPVVLTVHDEVVVEVATSMQLEVFLSLMRATPTWAPGLPIAVEGWEGERYRK